MNNMNDQSTLFSQTRGYDNVGNVTSVSTTLPAGTDNQVFCYDEQNRLTWAGSTGTPSCGTSLTPGSLTSAAYTASYAYDQNNRLTTGPAGAYTYGNTSHVDAVTSTSGGYTASYDAAGDMTCRAPSSSLTCSGTATGQSMLYDQLRRLLHWQNQTSSPTTTEGYVYDGEGQRVERAVTTGGTTTVTYTIGSYEDVTSVNGSTTITKYYGKSAVSVNGTISYLVDDGLGSVSESLSSSGSVDGAQLFAPYGAVRYSTGSFPGPQAFTGQRQDGSGLSYFNARYYDPVAGQFISADTVQGPNRYGYVAGNPETATDPTGQFGMCNGMATDDGICHFGPGSGSTGAGSSIGTGTGSADCADDRHVVNCPTRNPGGTDHGPGHNKYPSPIVIKPDNAHMDTLNAFISAYLAGHGVPADKLFAVANAVLQIIELELGVNDAEPKCPGFDGASCGTEVNFCFVGSPCNGYNGRIYGDRFTYEGLDTESDALGKDASKLNVIGALIAALGGLGLAAAAIAAIPSIPITFGLATPAIAILAGVSAFIAAIGGVLLAIAQIYGDWSSLFSQEHKYTYQGESDFYYATWNLFGVNFYGDGDVKCVEIVQTSPAFGGC